MPFERSMSIRAKTIPRLLAPVRFCVRMPSSVDFDAAQTVAHNSPVSSKISAPNPSRICILPASSNFSSFQPSRKLRPPNAAFGEGRAVGICDGDSLLSGLLSRACSTDAFRELPEGVTGASA